MAWVVPRTWVDDEIWAAPDMNDVRDSFSALALHEHTGVPGDGAGLSLGLLLEQSWARWNTDAV